MSCRGPSSRRLLLVMAVPVAAMTLGWLAADDRVSLLVTNTLLVAAGTCLLSVPLGTAVALLLVRTDVPFSRVWVVTLVVMLFVPLYVQAAAWQAGFDAGGVFSHGGILGGAAAVVWIHAVAAVPWVALIVGFALRHVEGELEDAALLDATPRTVFFRVTLRRAWPAVAVAALWVALATAGEITVTDLFQVRTYAEEVYTEFAVGGQPGRAPLSLLPGVALAVVLTAAALALCAYLAPRDHLPGGIRPRRFRLGRWRFGALAAVVVLLGTIAAVPLASLVLKAGVIVAGQPRVRGWSAAKCLEVVRQSPVLHRRELSLSLAVGVLVATSAVVLATILAWSARRGGVRRGAMLLTVAAALAVPAPLVGLGVIGLLNQPRVPPLVFLYDQSIAGLWITQLVRALPLTTLVMWHALRSVPAEMLDAAAVDGAGSWTRLCRVALPCRKAALVVAWLVALALAMSELAGGILASPPGVTTLPARLFGLLHTGTYDQIAGVCLLLVLLFSVLGLLALLAGRLWRGA